MKMTKPYLSSPKTIVFKLLTAVASFRLSVFLFPILLASCSGGPGQHYLMRSMTTPKRAMSLDTGNSSFSSYTSKTRYNYEDPTNSEHFRSKFDSEPNEEERKRIRNRIAKELAALIDENHAIYHECLRKSLTTNNVVWDFLTMGLTTSATVATGAQAIRALSAIATGTNGIGGKMNGRVLQEQTLATVLKAIRIRKEQAYARMQLKFDQGTAAYDLEDVILDLGRYWEAGLLASGVQQLDEMTSKTLNAVEQGKNEAKGDEQDEASKVLEVVNPKTGGE